MGNLNPGGKGLFGSTLNPGGGGGSLLKSILLGGFEIDCDVGTLGALVGICVFEGGTPLTGGGGITKLGGNLNPAGGVIPVGGLNCTGFVGGVIKLSGPGESTISFFSLSIFFSMLVDDNSSTLGTFRLLGCFYCYFSFSS